MSVRHKTKETNTPTVLRRMRESSGLTMRQAAGIVGISHVAISQFENEKLSLPDYRVEQLVRAYGFTLDEYRKIIGHDPVTSPKDDCHSMIDRMDGEQLTALRALMAQLLRPASLPSEAENGNIEGRK
jgi:transcriptional regulator with XRE-family HTH domain